ncbi:2-phosphosulfolactate phosphatase [Desulfarculus baarsii DSM 2075]|uniref:Probable 2-phosphosulfolactate phosphatase n=1 Tax=Desulfarculus baarsii (strain ATCC 33931 / DSM 2075 / LMG 7858 / VKM B-1802 / 2st14) TaxID=644282 RepID=E1QFT8_DESB2|nr:2-phosphosulfolactate phosphatase [Desulfarculus baarsii]ADK84548.1 2-phosphosulfolactate phosphatase [Desulfarculus baarsii DSM 2075]
MEIDIVSPADDLESLDGVVVVLDIFRASNTILALLAAGAGRVFLVNELDAARRLKAARPRAALLGERGGLPPADFDGGNSPAQAARLTRPGREVILTTSAGTKAIHRLGGAARVFYGAFAGAAALARAIEECAPRRVSLLAMGLEARQPADEDDAAAWFLAQRLRGQRPDFAAIRRRLLDCPGARRLRRLGQADDLEFCLSLDSQAIVPLARFGQPAPWAEAYRP